ncbi:MAG: hypothetical protein V4685_11300 [Bacteroidota bacterium]
MIKVKCKIVFLFFVCSISKMVQAQHATASLLKEPAGWEFERFDLPPVFAPSFPYKGVEELRFSPGMFKKDSADYFTYVFVAQLDNTTAFTQEDVKNYILNYYKALCSVTARDRKLSIDTSLITTTIEKKDRSAGNAVIYNATAGIFGVFDDGAPVKLNMEIKVVSNVNAIKTYLVFIASPKNKNDQVWKKLYEIQEAFIAP